MVIGGRGNELRSAHSCRKGVRLHLIFATNEKALFNNASTRVCSGRKDPCIFPVYWRHLSFLTKRVESHSFQLHAINSPLIAPINFRSIFDWRKELWKRLSVASLFKLEGLISTVELVRNWRADSPPFDPFFAWNSPNKKKQAEHRRKKCPNLCSGLMKFAPLCFFRTVFLFLH